MAKASTPVVSVETMTCGELVNLIERLEIAAVGTPAAAGVLMVREVYAKSYSIYLLCKEGFVRAKPVCKPRLVDLYKAVLAEYTRTPLAHPPAAR